MPPKRKATDAKKASRKRQRTFSKQSTGAIAKPVFATARATTKQYLRYCEYVTLNPGVGTTATYIFSANGMFDPNISGVGHQPRGYDQWMQLYSRYVVTKSKIIVQAANDSNASNTAIFGVSVSTDQTTSTVVEDHTESRLVSYTLLSKDAPRSVTQTFDLQAWKKGVNIMTDDVISGSTGANPPENYFFNVFAAALANGTDLGVINLFVTIEYEATLLDVDEPNIS